jgi:hypothetical protein
VTVLAVVGAVFILPTQAAHAVAGRMTASNGLFTGSIAPDTLSIFGGGGFLQNNRFGQGDPGFASPFDFDSTIDGEQKILTSDAATLGFIGLAGNDELDFSGFADSTTNVLKSLDLGAGTNTVSYFGTGGPATLVGSADIKVETIGALVGSSYDDYFDMSANGAPRSSSTLIVNGLEGDDTIIGTNGNDRIDGGIGTNHITAGAGNDTIVVKMPLPTAPTDMDGGTGTDTLLVQGAQLQGTDSNNDLAMLGDPTEMFVFDPNTSQGGYDATSINSVSTTMGQGDDWLLLSSRTPTSWINMGGGNDEVDIDTFQTTAKVTRSSATSATVEIPGAASPSTVFMSQTRTFYLLNETAIATGPGAGNSAPIVNTFRADGSPLASFFAYDPSFRGGVNVALGDTDGNYDDNIITGAGPGGGPNVRVFNADGSDTGVSFMAYPASFHGGVNVAAVDIDGDGVAEIVTVPATGPPRVRVYSGTGQLLQDWTAPGFTNAGLHVARGAELGVDGGDLILLSQVSGAPATIRAFNPDGTVATAFNTLHPFGSVFAGGASVSRAEFRGSASGVNVPAGDEIITAGGPGSAPMVRTFQRKPDGSYVNLATFNAYSQSFKGGVEVAACNSDGGDDEVVTAPTSGGPALIRTFDSTGKLKGTAFFAYDPSFTGGAHIACGGMLSRGFTS